MSPLLLPIWGRLLGTVPAIGAQQAVTGTATIPAARQVVTGTATALAQTAAPVLTPLPTPVIPQGHLTNPLSGDYLGAAAQAGLGPFSTAFLVLSAILLGAGLYFYFVGKRRWHRVHKLNYRLANFWSLVAMSLGLLGVLFMIFRLAGVEGLNLRFWLYLLLLAMLGFAAYAAYYFRLHYPVELAAYNKMTKARAPQARVRAATPRPGTPAGAPERLPGSAGNPRGTSPRGERRREKKR